MGAACCVAAKDRTIVSRSPGEVLQRHPRHSPTWSFRWDNRGRVAGEETSANWLHDGGSRNSHVEVKSGTIVDTAFASQGSSPVNSLQSSAMLKPPLPEGNGRISRLPSSGQHVSQNIVEVKEPTDSPSVSYPSPVKLSPSNSTPSKWHRRSPGQHLLRQVSDAKIPGHKSPSLSISEEPASFLNESSRGSFDSWSTPNFPNPTTTRRDRWSFDSDLSRDKIARSNGHSSRSSSLDLQTCGICTKLLTERSIWVCTSHKIMSTNEVSVVAVLTCGHVYHAECLDCMTPEICKYDPPCPVCTYGEKQAVKMSEKALKAELDPKARKRSRRRVLDDLSGDLFDHHKTRVDEKSPKTSAPFLKRHFSFGSKTSRSMSENPSSHLRRGFLWSRSIKN